MKSLNVLIASIIMFFALAVAAQTDTTSKDKNVNVPEQVTTKFSQEYPQTSNTSWKKDGDNYVVEFTTADSESKTIWYNKAGERQSEERALNAEKDLPSNLREIMSGKYAGYKVQKIVEVKNVGRTSYRLRVQKGDEIKDILLDDKGQEIDSGRY